MSLLDQLPPMRHIPVARHHAARRQLVEVANGSTHLGWRFGRGVTLSVAIGLAAAGGASATAFLHAQVPLNSRLADVNESSVPGVQRDRLEVATRLAELGPGGARADEATQEGAGITGIAVVRGGIEVTVSSDAALEATKAVIQKEIASIVAQSPDLADFGNLTYAVENPTLTPQSTSGRQKSLEGSPVRRIGGAVPHTMVRSSLRRFRSWVRQRSESRHRREAGAASRGHLAWSTCQMISCAFDRLDGLGGCRTDA